MTLSSKTIKAAQYNPDTKMLHLHFRRGGKIAFRDISQFHYDSLLQSDDADFYYRYYIEPMRVGSLKAGRGKLAPVAFSAMLIVLALLFSARDVEVNDGLRGDTASSPTASHRADEG